MFDIGSPYLNDLNERQLDAVTHMGGPLLVVAGAGTGKTKTLACRVAHLIAEGTAPERILLLTFTRRAATEMLGRVARYTSPAQAAAVWGGTFHATGARLLRRNGSALRLPPGFTVMDQGDTAELMGLVRADLGLAHKGRRFPKNETLVAIYSRTVNSQVKLADVLAVHFPWCAEELDDIKAAFRGYAQRKRDQVVLDFDDLLLFWRALMSVPRAGAAIGNGFEHILVDEYQDTNAIQADILRGMRAGSPGISAVGDDAQAIYSFRSATVANIRAFPEHFPGTRLVMLEQNYRSTPPVLRASNAVIAQSAKMYEKNLWTDRPGEAKPVLLTCFDEAKQSEAVCAEVLEQRERGLPLRQQAVLFRAAWHSTHLEVELARRNIPFVKYGGLRFVEAAHVKDVVALLRIIANPLDELAWFRALQLLEGVGPGTAKRALTELGVGRAPGGPDHGISPLRRLIDAPPELPASARPELEGLRGLLAECSAGAPPALQVARFQTWFDPVCRRRYQDADARLADIEQLAGIASDYSSVDRLIADLALDAPHATGALAGPPLLDDDYLILSTMHSAKGCEWDSVHVIHAADGMIPSDMATGDEDDIEEERRLFYVALTRARSALFVYFPLRYYHRRMGLADAHNYAQLTRFIPAEVRDAFEQKSLQPRQGSDPAAPSLRSDAVDAFLEELWS